MADRLTVYAAYKKAIEVCSLTHMQKLDSTWCEINAEKKYK